MITNNAKGLISIIAFEVRLADQRVAGGHITQGQVAGCVYERLIAKSKENVDLKTFLTTMAFIPEDEDTDENVEWAEDTRDSRQHTVDHRTGESKSTGPGARPIEKDTHWPAPGERIC